MLRFILLMSLTSNYEKQLLTEIKTILHQHKECTREGYDNIYKNISILEMIHPDLDFRYDAVMALRERCNGKLSRWELGL